MKRDRHGGVLRSTKTQLAVTLVATLVAAGFLLYRGLPPSQDLFDSVRDDDSDQARRALHWGCPTTPRGMWNRTPLHWATDHGYRDMAELLIAGGNDVNTQDDIGWTPLHLVAMNGRTDIAELLIAHKGDVNANDVQGATPLHKAVTWGYEDIVGILIAEGADVNARDSRGATPLEEAVMADHRAIVELLWKHGGKM
jgi:ankyrin repeat protein